MSLSTDSDTICAIATPPGRGGVGIIRISGPLAGTIAQSILHFAPQARHAHYSDFRDANSELIDQGIALFFPAPHSFTGEDVVEFQGHGGAYVLDRLLNTIVSAGARLARPGEFSERAFINDKLDLAQAEAIADLIEASSEEAAKSAMRTLQGDFSRLIQQLCDAIIELRVYIEASIDFSEEEIDFLTEGKTQEKLEDILNTTDSILAQAKQGSILRDGMSVVIAGKPNAGKSSLLNALAGKDAAIVTEIAGTTRDTLVEHISIDGMPVHITDTAGLRNSDDIVEQEGIRRALKAIREADRILLVVDSSEDLVTADTAQAFLHSLGLDAHQQDSTSRLSLIRNKIDRTGESATMTSSGNGVTTVSVSARSGEGVDLLRKHLKDCMGYAPGGEGTFIARRRHLDALHRARGYLTEALDQLKGSREGELVAEDLKQAHRCLGEITGEFSTDELLGKIFSSFCVGK